MAFDRSARWQRWAVLLPLCTVVFAYSGAVEAGFVRDDHLLIEDEARVRALQPLSSYFARMFWSDPLDVSRSFYRPLTTVSFAIDWQLWSGNPAGFHVTNVALHLAVVLLLFALCVASGATPPVAAFAAALFGALPRLTESVAWISGRTDVLAAAFVLAALWLHDPEDRGTKRRIAAGALLFLGLLSKEVAIAGVAGVVARELHRGRRQRAWLHLWPAAVGVAAYVALRLFAASADPPRALKGTGAETDFTPRLSTAVAAVGEYARMSFVFWRPELLIGDRADVTAGQIALGALVLASAAVALFRFRGLLSEWQATAAATGAVSVALVLHVLPLNLTQLAADRFLYFPAAMLCLFIARPLSSAADARRAVFAVLGVVLLASFCAAARSRVSEWADEYSLWKRAVDSRRPGQGYVLLGLANVLMDADLHGRALPYLEQALKEEGGRADVKLWNAYAVALDKAGRRSEALPIFERLARGQPQASRPRLNLALSYARDGRFDDALRALDDVANQPAAAASAAQLRKLIVEARTRLGSPSAQTPDAGGAAVRATVLEELGAFFEAERLWRSVLSDPAAPDALRLRALGYLSLRGDPERALSELEKLPASEQVSVMRDAARDRDRLR